MKKAIVLFMFLLAGASFAQTLRLGIGPNLAMPAGSFSDIANTGFGGTAQAEVGLLGYSITGSVGYLSFGAKEISTPGLTIKHTTSAIPVLVGTKFSILPLIYGAASLGMNFITTQVDQTTFGHNISESQSDSKFGFAVGAGVQLLMLDVSVKYQSMDSDANFYGLTVLYNIGF